MVQHFGENFENSHHLRQGVMGNNRASFCYLPVREEEHMAVR